MKLPDTFYTLPPHWDWWIIFYFFIGGIGAGSLFIAGVLHLIGRPADRQLIRIASYVALIGAVLSGIILILDLGKPLRFWHMVFESETGQLMFKWWSPMSVGVWGLLVFSTFAFLAALGAAHEERRVGWAPAGRLVRGPLSTIVAIGGILSGLFLAGYTGVLLAVTNRPMWADSSWLGILFLFSAVSTAAAALILLARRRNAADAAALDSLGRFDKAMLVLELIALIVFLITLGGAARVFLGIWGVLLVVLVLGMGILLPLAMGFGYVRRGWRHWDVPTTTAALVLFGGFFLRVIILLASEQVTYAGARVITP